MNCRQLVELVTEYVEDRLTVEERADFEEHLGLCSGCVRYLAQFRTTIALLGELPEETLSPSARGQLLEAFAGWRPRDPGQTG
jgi:anti-sigma factor RsiW